MVFQSSNSSKRNGRARQTSGLDTNPIGYLEHVILLSALASIMTSDYDHGDLENEMAQ